MLKKTIGIVAVVAMAAVAGWNYQQNQNKVEMSDLTLANVEALASGESVTDFCKGCIFIQTTICRSTAVDGCLGVTHVWETR